ncbi:MAG: hypothetical protein DMG14_22105 [Acidobacteria bacterium]|nr:MAG: hypothetical protein DMG14_22105 [Acidobacteriota bacterium]
MSSLPSQLLVLWLIAQPQAATLKYAGAPAPPLNSPFAGVVILKADRGASGDVQSITALAGAAPFLEASISAVKQWKFAPVQGQEKPAPVSVTMFYRARQIFSSTSATQFPEWPAAETRPPLPHVIVEPSYPVNSVAEGVVILELRISADGGIERIETVRQVPSLMEIARKAVEGWKFTPASINGQASSGTAIVAISFLRPVIY